MLGLLVCLLAVSVLTAAQRCPEGCENGNCVAGACKCSPGWIGNDCSIPLTELVSGQSVEATVETNAWNYYHMQVVSGALSVTLVGIDTDDSDSDCDLFVKYSKLPTAYDYDGRDTGWGSNAHVEIKDATPGDWYVGVFGSLTRCHYSLNAVTEGGCPGGCNNNGRCAKGSDGYSCVCDTGFTGDHCEKYLYPNPLLLNTPFEGTTMVQGAWTNYYFEVSQEILKLDLIVNVTSDTICDFYINYLHAPDFTHWEYVSPDALRNFVIVMEEVAVGRWFIGVFTGQHECTYTMTLKTEDVQCTGECSRRGNCGPPCECRPSYTGDYCQYRQQALVSGETDSGFVDENLFHWYKYPANTNNDIVIHIDQQGSTGDCDLYIKHNSPPSLQDYDDMEISNSTSFDLLVTDALMDVIYIAVFGYEPCTYTIKVTEQGKSETCQDGSSCINGSCRGNDGCVCNPGWIGIDCSTESKALLNGQKYSSVISSQNQWLYYTYTLRHSTFLVTLKENTEQVADTGYLYLLMNQGNIPPNLREHDFANYSPSSGFHTITIGLDSHPADDFPMTFTIAVYGSPFVHDPVPFDLVVWEPDF